MEELKCIGCGSTIQSEEKTAPGFLPKSKLADENVDVVCRRCFRLKNYNELTPLSITKDDYFNIIAKIGNENALIVKIIDIFDIEGSLIPQISKLTNHNDLIILANKVDLLPKSIKEGKLIHHLRKIISDNNLKPIDIFVMSAIKYKNIDVIMENLIEEANGRDIYVVGATNVGKSTFINSLLKSYADTKKDIITVSSTAGTTLDLIKIPLDGNFIIDTPGLINDNQITHYLSPKGVKTVMPKKEIKPMSFQLNSGQSLFFGGIARIDFLSGDKTTFVCYVSEFLKIHRTKLENADELYQNHIGKLLSPPYEGDPEIVLKSNTFKINSVGKTDIVLPGLGFVTVKGNISVKVYTKVGTVPYVRGALI
jgi:ribosome biogenesis GTPase YqeH